MKQRIIFLPGIFLAASLLLAACASAAPRYEMDSAAYEVAENSGFSAQRAEEQSESRMIAYTVSLELSVRKVEGTKEALLEQVNRHNGFIVRESDNFINARIPVTNLDSFVTDAKTLGKVDNESKTGTDITDQYRDNVIRLSNLKTVRDRYVTLLEKANTVTDILSIEKELERVNTEIEIMEGRIKYAEQSVAYSNVTVRLRERAKPGPVGWIFYGLFQGIKWLFVWD